VRAGARGEDLKGPGGREALASWENAD